jgi:hypothetical protein
MGGARWKDNWRVVAPSGAARFDVPRSPARRRRLEHELEELVLGTPVVLAASGPSASRRCRRLAAAAGVTVERTYVALPSAVAPAYLVEDRVPSIRFFLGELLAAPPATRGRRILVLGVAAFRLLPSWRLARALPAGRVIVGVRG